ncbi:diacylglycerol kinase family lipid kinase [Deinococcus sp. KNUC1210]|uniref:diacylglycerol/lipid kinase family protein n=1 Tax=Deinococcus sp. KNUC1210 TaxID=2917691 RepID=UPI001EF0CA33|nr:diacylglycerol kinase family protein [Deinococcus sp. KNUC1210]ULH16395.1 diacylglycerol kinase family lipid kinase [Deinococcus sp. KNUC1210]
MPTTSPPFAVILNTQAGSGLAGREWPRLEAELDRHGLTHQLLRTGSAEEARWALAQLPPEHPVLAVGGDGTVYGLLPELRRSGRALGVVPLGSGNDFAGMLNLQPGDFGAALARLSRPATSFDLLEVQLEGETKWTTLLNGLGMGFDAQITALMSDVPTRLLGVQLGGQARYLWAALDGLRHLENEHLDVLLDDQPWYSGPSCLVAVMNGRRYGGGFLIAPEANPQDGLMDVVLGSNLSRSALLPLMGRVLRGTHLTHPSVHTARARKVSVSWTRPMYAHLDGDVIGRQAGLHIRVVPSGLNFLSSNS